MQTFKDQLENKTANNSKDIKKLFPFVITENYKEFSEWHMQTVTYTQYGFKKNGNNYFFARRTSNLDKSYDYDDIILILNTLKNSNYKYACYYCQKGFLGSPNKFLNPIDFINWVKQNNYNYEDFTSITKIREGIYRFQGNLKEYSSAFWFDIFDRDLIMEILTKTSLTIKEGG